MSVPTLCRELLAASARETARHRSEDRSSTRFAELAYAGHLWQAAKPLVPVEWTTRSVCFETTGALALLHEFGSELKPDLSAILEAPHAPRAVREILDTNPPAEALVAMMSHASEASSADGRDVGTSAAARITGDAQRRALESLLRQILVELPASVGCTPIDPCDQHLADLLQPPLGELLARSTPHGDHPLGAIASIHERRHGLRTRASVHANPLRLALVEGLAEAPLLAKLIARGIEARLRAAAGWSAIESLGFAIQRAHDCADGGAFLDALGYPTARARSCPSHSSANSWSGPSLAFHERLRRTLLPGLQLFLRALPSTQPESCIKSMLLTAAQVRRLTELYGSAADASRRQ
jgi:hypothetical protein